MPAKFNIKKSQSWWVGEDTPLNVDVTEDDDVTPQNMAGWGLLWKFKTSRIGRTVITKTTGDGITIGNGSGTDDRATISIDSADTIGMSQVRGWHELWRTDSGTVVLLTQGYAWLLNSGHS